MNDIRCILCAGEGPIGLHMGKKKGSGVSRSFGPPESCGSTKVGKHGSVWTRPAAYAMQGEAKAKLPKKSHLLQMQIASIPNR